MARDSRMHKKVGTAADKFQPAANDPCAKRLSLGSFFLMGNGDVIRFMVCLGENATLIILNLILLERAKLF